MTILPLGTANNIAKSLGILGSVPELAAGWATAPRRVLRLGSARTAEGTARFVESVGVGVFNELITRGRAEVDESSTGLTGHAIDRALLLLERIAREHAARPRRLTLDGRDLSGEYLLIEAMHMPLIGPNVPLAPSADCYDSLLDVVTVSERERGRLADYARARVTGEAAGLELPIRRGKVVMMEASPEELHVDDDRWEPEGNGGATQAELREGEVSIAVDAAAVEVLVPAHTR
jgi:diacylglycerol kinase family enzyme